jgi:hypothetical protein
MSQLNRKLSAGVLVAAGLASAGAMLAAAAPGAAAQAAPASSPAATTTTTLAPPAQGVGAHKVFMYVDTVTGGGTPKPAAGCAQTNLFQRGQTVVFRMYGVNVAAGGVNLTSANVAFAYVQIPGVKAVPMKFGNHGTNSYWTGAWTIGSTYPLGVVDFSVHLTTDRVPPANGKHAVARTGAVFTQAGLATPSRLTVVAA